MLLFYNLVCFYKCLIGNNLMFTFFCPFDHFATQGASSSGLFLNSRVCPISVSVSVFLYIHFPSWKSWVANDHYHIRVKSWPIPPLLFCQSRRGQAGMSKMAAGCCFGPCVFAQDPLHSWKGHILAGEQDAWSCIPSWFQRVAQTCVCLGTF